MIDSFLNTIFIPPEVIHLLNVLLRLPDLSMLKNSQKSFQV
jgi:hypothetical protein